MNKIVSKEFFSDKVVKLVIEAPLIAKARKAGHFVIVRVDEKGERLPLTIAGADIEKGTITLVLQTVGKDVIRYMTASKKVPQLGEEPVEEVVEVAVEKTEVKAPVARDLS